MPAFLDTFNTQASASPDQQGSAGSAQHAGTRGAHSAVDGQASSASALPNWYYPSAQGGQTSTSAWRQGDTSKIGGTSSDASERYGSGN